MMSKKQTAVKAKQEAEEKAIKEAKKRLATIECTKPDIPKHIDILAVSHNAAKHFKYYPRINKEIRDLFGTDLDKIEPASLNEKGASLGTVCHSVLSKYIREDQTIGKEEKAACEAINEILQIQYPGFQLLESEVPLCGFTKANQSVNFWNGKADAIAWCDGQYVIVDWKFVPDLTKFWTDAETYRLYFHQCLVYARLLQLHLKLDELPYILIVPINSFTGKDIQPGLFKDYPQECKAKLEEYVWSETAPTEEQKLRDWDNLIKEPHRGKEIPQATKLKDLFSEDATFQDFLKVFHLPLTEGPRKKTPIEGPPRNKKIEKYRKKKR